MVIPILKFRITTRCDKTAIQSLHCKTRACKLDLLAEYFTLYAFNIAHESLWTAEIKIPTFGLPSFDCHADPTPWLCAFPMLGLMRHMHNYSAPEGDNKADTTDNGSPPQIEKKEETAAKEKEAPKEGEKKEESPVDQVGDAICNTMAKIFAVIGTCAAQVLAVRAAIHEKIMGLPWECAMNLATTFGTGAAMTLAYWSLTNDRLNVETDVLWTLTELVIPDAPQLRFPVYFGAGGRVRR